MGKSRRGSNRETERGQCLNFFPSAGTSTDEANCVDANRIPRSNLGPNHEKVVSCELSYSAKVASRPATCFLTRKGVLGFATFYIEVRAQDYCTSSFGIKVGKRNRPLIRTSFLIAEHFGFQNERILMIERTVLSADPSRIRMIKSSYPTG